MKVIEIIFLTCILISITSCSSIKLADNCGKQNAETFIVLPFVGDDYACNFDIENKIRNLCYSIESGMSLLNEYSYLVNKNFLEIELNDFCDYVKDKGIDYVVIGSARVEWYEGKKPIGFENSTGASSSNSSMVNPLELRSYYLMTGNYVIVDCYTINTNNKNKKELFRNYKVKKVSLGMPLTIN